MGVGGREKEGRSSDREAETETQGPEPDACYVVNKRK